MNKQVFFPSMLLDSSVIECQLVDLPVINNFPTSSDEEWTNFRYFGLRRASAYILIYDVSYPTSFQFIQSIREQISLSRSLSDTPIIVAANKSDLCKNISKQDVAATVRKSWRSSYVECSAKHNWNITSMFKQVAREVVNKKENVTREREEEQQQCCRLFR
jgi:Ras-like protein family protein 10B